MKMPGIRSLKTLINSRFEALKNLNELERRVLIHGAIWFFLILGGYYILRPIREQISSSYGIQNLAWLFWATFSAMLVAIPLYSILVGKLNRSVLVPSIYSLFFFCLIGFWCAMNFLPQHFQVWVARCLYVWISVYGLFIVSFFWSVMGDLLTTQQGRRIFGFIFASGTIGGMLGSQLALHLVNRIGIANLLLIPAAALIGSLTVYALLERSVAASDMFVAIETSGKATGGNPFAGFTAVFKSRYLFSICIYGLFLAVCGTAVYFQQSEIVRATIESPEERTAYFASVNFAVSWLTFIFQFLLVKFLMRRFGIGWTLACLPLAYVIGISSLAISPSIEILAVISVLGRSAEYGIANPAREVLYTSVSREDRYKAKSFIDTVVRRGGDTLIGTTYRTLRESAGLAMVTLSWLVIPLALAWTGLALFIGRENQKIAGKTQDSQRETSSL